MTPSGWTPGPCASAIRIAMPYPAIASFAGNRPRLDRARQTHNEGHQPRRGGSLAVSGQSRVTVDALTGGGGSPTVVRDDGLNRAPTSTAPESSRISPPAATPSSGWHSTARTVPGGG